MNEVSNEEEQPQVRVTAIVVSFNNVEQLRVCLTALQASQDREALEIIVVDKGSRDGSATIDAEFPNVTVLRLPRNFGNTKALNISMRTAVADLMFFLAPEVTVKPDTIAQLEQQMAADPDAVAVCPVLDTNQFYRLPTPASGDKLDVVSVDSGEAVVPVEGATFDAMLASKYFIRGINFLDEKYGESWSDVDLCFQIRRSGKKVLAAPAITCLYTPRPDRFPDSALKVLEADRVAGAARYFGKYYGFMSSLMYKLKATLGALFSGRIGLFIALLGSRKVDGTQSEL